MVKKYLSRINYVGEAKPDCETLKKLQRSHLLTVPYENLDIIRNVPLRLDPAGIYEKIVENGRGGYCFELNGLFAWLLKSIGYEVTDYMARFLRDETAIPMRRHRVLRVGCEGSDYLCDVGVGGVIPRSPLRLIDGNEETQGDERYKIECEPFFGRVLYEWKEYGWRRLYSFTEEEQLDIDYVMPSYYCENNPDSFFRTRDMVHIFTENGRKSVSGREFRIFTREGCEVIEPQTEDEYRMLLKKHFGIKIGPVS